MRQCRARVPAPPHHHPLHAEVQRCCCRWYISTSPCRRTPPPHVTITTRVICPASHALSPSSVSPVGRWQRPRHCCNGGGGRRARAHAVRASFMRTYRFAPSSRLMQSLSFEIHISPPSSSLPSFAPQFCDAAAAARAAGAVRTHSPLPARTRHNHLYLRTTLRLSPASSLLCSVSVTRHQVQDAGVQNEALNRALADLRQLL